MKKLKAIAIFGTRPEAIKMAPVIKLLKEEEVIDLTVISTGQHQKMLKQVLDLFSIKPDYKLEIMRVSQSLTDITVKILAKLEGIFEKERPDLVVVHGDTTTTFASALAAFYQGIKTVHLEAGLRSNNKFSPFPEEINRRLTGSLADFHFAPTIRNKNNLLAERITEKNIFITGNTVIDALFEIVDDKYSFSHPILKEINFKKKKVILLTAHRRENLGHPLKEICWAIKEIVEENKEVEVVFPVHLNPKVRRIVYPILDGHRRIHLLKPLDYKSFVNLMAKAYLIVTDSGGIQEEAPALAKPVLVLREETERKEALQAGTVRLVGRNRKNIILAINLLLKDKEQYQKMAMAINPYGDGMAAKRVKEAILYYFGYKKERPEEFGVDLQEL